MNTLDKVQVCFEKAAEIVKFYCGNYDVRVGDSYFNLGLACKHSLNLEQARVYLLKALPVYCEGVGIRSLQTANCLTALGKVTLLSQMDPNLAIRYFEEALITKQQIYKAKPRGNEIHSLQ